MQASERGPLPGAGVRNEASGCRHQSWGAGVMCECYVCRHQRGGPGVSSECRRQSEGQVWGAKVVGAGIRVGGQV